MHTEAGFYYEKLVRVTTEVIFFTLIGSTRFGTDDGRSSETTLRIHCRRDGGTGKGGALPSLPNDQSQRAHRHTLQFDGRDDPNG